MKETRLKNNIKMGQACALLCLDPLEVHNITVWVEGYSVMCHNGNGFTRAGRITTGKLWAILRHDETDQIVGGDLVVVQWEQDKPIMQNYATINVPTEDRAVWDVLGNAAILHDDKPTLVNLVDTFAGAISARDGNKERPLRFWLVRLAGACINMVRRIDSGENINLKS